MLFNKAGEKSKLKVFKQLSQNNIVCGNRNHGLKPGPADFLKIFVSYNTPGRPTAVSAVSWRWLHLTLRQFLTSKLKIALFLGDPTNHTSLKHSTYSCSFQIKRPFLQALGYPPWWRGLTHADSLPPCGL